MTTDKHPKKIRKHITWYKFLLLFVTIPLLASYLVGIYVYLASGDGPFFRAFSEALIMPYAFGIFWTVPLIIIGLLLYILYWFIWGKKQKAKWEAAEESKQEIENIIVKKDDHKPIEKLSRKTKLIGLFVIVVLILFASSYYVYTYYDKISAFSGRLSAPDNIPGRIAFHDGDFFGGSGGNQPSQIYIVDANGENLQQLIDDEYINYNPELSPDGNMVAYLSTRYDKTCVMVIDADGSKRTIIEEIYEANDISRYNTAKYSLEPFSWSPDSNYIAVIDYDYPDSNLNISDLTKREYGTYNQLMSFTEYRYDKPNWSPDGSFLLVVSNYPDNLSSDENFVLIDLKTLDHTVLPITGRNVTWAPDSKKIIYEYKDIVYVYDIDSNSYKETEKIYNPLSLDVCSVSGNEFIFIMTSNWGYLINAMSMEQSRYDLGDWHNIHSSFSPDCKWVAFGAESDSRNYIIVLDLASGETFKIVGYGEKPDWGSNNTHEDLQIENPVPTVSAAFIPTEVTYSCDMPNLTPEELVNCGKHLYGYTQNDSEYDARGDGPLTGEKERTVIFRDGTVTIPEDLNWRYLEFSKVDENTYKAVRDDYEITIIFNLDGYYHEAVWDSGENYLKTYWELIE